MRDKERLMMAFVMLILSCMPLPAKQVPAMEYNPVEG